MSKHAVSLAENELSSLAVPFYTHFRFLFFILDFSGAASHVNYPPKNCLQISTPYLAQKLCLFVDVSFQMPSKNTSGCLLEFFPLCYLISTGLGESGASVICLPYVYSILCSAHFPPRSIMIFRPHAPLIMKHGFVSRQQVIHLLRLRGETRWPSVS